jgi:hypothetical protein
MGQNSLGLAKRRRKTGIASKEHPSVDAPQALKPV